MDEHEFDALFPYRAFGNKEATEHYARLHRNAALASALFGKTPEDLRQQLLVPYPKIPAGFSLSDFRDLRRLLEMALAAPANPSFAGSSLVQQLASRSILVGTQRHSVLEAHYEIVCRAIEFLEKQK
jgi:hypothetical protein